MTGSGEVPPNAPLDGKASEGEGRSTEERNAAVSGSSCVGAASGISKVVPASAATESADETLSNFLREIGGFVPDPASGKKADVPVTAAVVSSGDDPPDDDSETEPTDAELERLRQLLFSQEIAELKLLRRRVGNHDERTQDISNVLADALLRLKTNEERAKIKAALQNTVESIFTESAQRNPASLADHIFPVMGPAIKKAISENFLSMLQNFNKSLEISFTPKGLRWRLEAFRTGKPFSEIVLLHTLVYRIEQVFLIHAETGIVLQHMVNEGVNSQDADLVSSMLTAVQDFVRDCFIRDQNDKSSLDSMQLGEHTIFVERAPRIYLAYVVRGTPPVSLREQFREMLAVSVAECGDKLWNFDGDVSGFSHLRRHFEKFLVAQYVDDDKKAPLLLRWAPFAILLLLIGGAIFACWRQGDQESRFHEAVIALDNEEGVVVTSVSTSAFGLWRISFFRDELAPEPAKILTAAGMPEDRFELKEVPYISLDRSIVRQRVGSAVRPIEGVELHFDENRILHMTGQAQTGWIMAARERALATGGVKGVDTKGIVDPRMEELRRLVSEVESTVVHFVSGKETPIPEDRAALVRAADNLAVMEKLAAAMDIAVSLVIYGHADATGTEKVNYEISQKRAQMLAAMLYGRGSSMPIALYAMGADFAVKQDGRGRADQDSRRVELRVKLTRAENIDEEFLRKQ
ncbi:hypothetical protein FACS1894205_5420 [Alphaproteobacteria bacterium]|nr:hypothetical protein FACS1894205_5420 [Alphaproteobacteria bacterium]